MSNQELVRLHARHRAKSMFNEKLVRLLSRHLQRHGRTSQQRAWRGHGAGRHAKERRKGKDKAKKRRAL